MYCYLFVLKFCSFWAVLSLCCCLGSSLVVVRGGLLSSYCAQASRCRGFSCNWASIVVAHGLSHYGFQVLEHGFNSCGM